METLNTCPPPHTYAQRHDKQLFHIDSSLDSESPYAFSYNARCQGPMRISYTAAVISGSMGRLMFSYSTETVESVSSFCHRFPAWRCRIIAPINFWLYFGTGSLWKEIKEMRSVLWITHIFLLPPTPITLPWQDVQGNKAHSLEGITFRELFAVFNNAAVCTAHGRGVECWDCAAHEISCSGLISLLKCQWYFFFLPMLSKEYD